MKRDIYIKNNEEREAPFNMQIKFVIDIHILDNYNIFMCQDTYLVI